MHQANISITKYASHDGGRGYTSMRCVLSQSASAFISYKRIKNSNAGQWPPTRPRNPIPIDPATPSGTRLPKGCGQTDLPPLTGGRG